HQQLVRSSINPLREVHHGRALGARLTSDGQLVIQLRRATIFERQSRNSEQNSGRPRQLLLRVAQRAQPLGAGALEKPQIVRIVNDATTVRVFPVDADGPGKQAHSSSSANNCSVVVSRSDGLI